MSLYVDTSALLKRYIAEADSARCEAWLRADPDWVSCRLTAVEVRRNLARLLVGQPLVEAREDFDADWRRMHIIELDAGSWEQAARIAEGTSCRSLDAVHLAAARRLEAGMTFLTFDIRQALVARSLGLTVLGA